MPTDEYVASCFISYNHADAELARNVATGLEALGYFVWIDEGRLKAGDSLITAIGDAIDRVDFLVALVSEGSVQSNWCQKELAIAMTGEINRRGISVLPRRVGSVEMPPTLSDKLYLEADAMEPEALVSHLDRHMRLHLAPDAPIPPRRTRQASQSSKRSWVRASSGFDPSSPVRMIGVDLNGVTQPRNDGTRGSALYKIPIKLDPTPDQVWGRLFVKHWDHPQSWTSMHRPGIASVAGDSIILNGTTMEELERVHMATLKLAVNAANDERREIEEREQAAKHRDDDARAAQAAKDAEIANRLDFD